jgi:hypothetical protein
MSRPPETINVFLQVRFSNRRKRLSANVTTASAAKRNILKVTTPFLLMVWPNNTWCYEGYTFGCHQYEYKIMKGPAEMRRSKRWDFGDEEKQEVGFWEELVSVGYPIFRSACIAPARRARQRSFV